MKLFLLFLLLCFSYKRLKELRPWQNGCSGFAAGMAASAQDQSGPYAEYARIAGRLAIDSHSEELQFFEKTISALNDTVYRLRCPVGWVRKARSCYFADPRGQPNYASANSRCVHMSAKPSSTADGRVSVATVRSPLELHHIAGIMAKAHLNRVHIMMSDAMIKSAMMFHDRLDRLFIAKTQAPFFLSRRRHCSSVGIQNMDALITTMGRQESVQTKPVARPAACFVLDFAPSVEFQQCSYPIAVWKETPATANRSSSSDASLQAGDNLMQMSTNQQPDGFLKETGNDTAFASVQTGAQGSDDLCTAATGHCTLIFNEQCSCPDACHFICEYTTDLCAMNPLCGSHGRCVDSLKSGLKCECNFLYGGTLCDKVTADGIQVLVCIALIIITTFANSWLLRRALASVLRTPILAIHAVFAVVRFCRCGRSTAKRSSFASRRAKPSPLTSVMDKLRTRYLFGKPLCSSSAAGVQRKYLGFVRRPLDLLADSLRPFSHSRPRRKGTHMLSTHRGSRLQSTMNSGVSEGKAECKDSSRDEMPEEEEEHILFYKRNKLRRTVIVSACTLVITTILLTTTSITQMIAFRSDFSSEHMLRQSLNRSLHIVKRCQMMTNFVQENLISFPFALGTLFVFAWFTKRDTYCRHFMDGRPGLPTPMEPFKMKNRFTTAIIFGLLSCEVLKIFEELLFKTSAFRPLGILIDLSVRVGFVFLIGMRYYPLLSSLQLRTNVACTCVACVYAWFDMIYVVVKQGFCMGFVPISSLSGLVGEARLRLELGTWYVVYGLVRNAPHFACLAFIVSEFSLRFLEALQNKVGTSSRLDSAHCGLADSQDCQLKLYDRDLRGDYSARRSVRKLFPSVMTQQRMPASYASAWDGLRNAKLTIHRTGTTERFFSLAFTDSAPNHLYVKNLLMGSVRRRRALIGKRNSVARNGTNEGLETRLWAALAKCTSGIYIWRSDFRFSTIAVCTFVTAFIFLYYLACTLAFYHLSRTEGHGFVLNFYFRHILNVWPSVDGTSDAARSGLVEWDEGKREAVADAGYNGNRNSLTFWREICVASIIAYAVFAVQMFHSMKQYRTNKLMMYKGIFEDIPSARHIKPSKMIAQSVHYSGFLIGYMAWGFIIVFYICLVTTCTFSLMFRQRVQVIATLVAFLLPVCMVYALKIILVRSASRAMFTQGSGSMMALNNRRLHAAFVYFNFFFDCFLGIVACLSRLCKAILLNVLFMARLDYSFVGRPLERLDPGFSTYVAYLHTEVAHTHPVMVTFCDMAWRQIVLRRVGLLRREPAYSASQLKWPKSTPSSSVGTGLPLMRSHRRERACFRWLLSYTLIRNNGLLSFRKNLSSRLQRIILSQNQQRRQMYIDAIRSGQAKSETTKAASCLGPNAQWTRQRNQQTTITEKKFGQTNEIILDRKAKQTSMLNESRMLKDGDVYIVPPSIKIFSTTGIGELKASAGEHMDVRSKDEIYNREKQDTGTAAEKHVRFDGPKNDQLAYIDESDVSDDDSSDEETIRLLKPPLVCNRKSYLPLVLDTAYLAMSSMSAGPSLHPQDGVRNARHSRNQHVNLLDSDMVNKSESTRGLIDPDCGDDVPLHDVGTVLRAASYSERDALWRQGVRERVSQNSRYRFHYGCLNQLAAVKVIDFAHYRYISTQQQKFTEDDNGDGNYSVCPAGFSNPYSFIADSQVESMDGRSSSQQISPNENDCRQWLSPDQQRVRIPNKVQGAVTNTKKAHPPARPPPPQKQKQLSAGCYTDDASIYTSGQDQVHSLLDNRRQGPTGDQNSNTTSPSLASPLRPQQLYKHQALKLNANIQQYSRSPSRLVGEATVEQIQETSNNSDGKYFSSCTSPCYQSNDGVDNRPVLLSGLNDINSLISTTTGDDLTYATAQSTSSANSSATVMVPPPAASADNFEQRRQYLHRTRERFQYDQVAARYYYGGSQLSNCAISPVGYYNPNNDQHVHHSSSLPPPPIPPPPLFPPGQRQPSQQRSISALSAMNTARSTVNRNCRP